VTSPDASTTSIDDAPQGDVRFRYTAALAGEIEERW
jgi:hypothetical protein